jgi:tetratricopeptide (TPR) repeat protein
VARVAVCAGAVAAIAAVMLPLAGARDIAQSRAAAARGDLRGALADARSAHGVQPYAASPLLQEALVLEAAGDLPAARDAAVGAVSREATNWQPRLVLARIESELGLKGQAVAAFSRARSLDPLGKAFNP